MSRKIAYGGILLSLNSILLLMVNILPTNTLFILGLASTVISIIIMEYGPRFGVVFYLANVLLSYIIIANKSQWILYIFTFGIYGLIKYIIEQNRNFMLEYIMKLAVANVLVIIVYTILREFIYVPINIITIVGFQIIFIVYDFMYSQWIDYYNQKIRKFINK